MSADTQQGEGNGSPASFEAARMQLARLHASPQSRLRDLWLELAGIAARTLSVERVGVWILADEGRVLRCRYLLQFSSQQVFQGADKETPRWRYAPVPRRLPLSMTA